MANIFISYYKIQENDISKPQHTIEGLANEFAKCGNNVLTLNTALFNPYASNTVVNKNLDNHILTAFDYFRPDIVIAFNHRIPQSILNHWSGKIVIYDGDHPNYFCGTDTILANLDRYEIFSIVKGWKDDYIKLGYDAERIHYIPMATCVQKEDVPFECNVSFLGQRFMYSRPYQSMIKQHEFYHNIHAMLNEFYTTDTYDYLELFKKYFPEAWDKYLLGEQDLYPFFDVRCAALSALTELGMRLCAHNGRWEFLDTTFPHVAASFDPRIVWSLKENTDFYNRSRLSLCPMHPQAKGAGFSWRALDVFASNSCLLSSESSELKELIRDYVDLPTFKSPSQAFALARTLLENENRRQSIVSACQQYVEDHARWVHRFRDMERILDMPLINDGGEPGYVNHMYEDSRFMNLVKKGSPASPLKGKPTTPQNIVYKIKKAAIKIACLGIPSSKKRKAFRNTALSALENNPNSFFSEKQKIKLKSWRFLSSEKRKAYRNEALEKHANQDLVALHAKYDVLVKNIQKLDRPVRVGFFVLFNSVFPAEPLFKKMLQDPHFEPFIAIIPDTSRGVGNMRRQMQKSYQELSDKYDNVFLAYDEQNASFVDFKEKMDIFCTALPYDKMTHKYYTMEYLKDKCLSIFFNYTFSTLVYVHEVIKTKFMSQVWKVFLETEECLEELKKVQMINGRNAVVSGYIKMDAMKEVKQEERSRKRIYICPHHTVMGWSKLDISHFLEYHEFFLELAVMFPDVDFIFRPHPLLFVNLRKFSIWPEEEIEDYLHRIEALPNMVFDESGSYLEAFANSDGMIHDCGSFIAEYLYTEKPVCYMLKDKKQLDDTFLPIGRMCIENHYHVYTREDIIHFIKDIVLNGNDTMYAQRKKFIDEKLRINYPDVSDFVLDHLKEQFFINRN